MSATAAFAALGKPVMGWLADYFGAKVTIWIELFCQGTALLVFGTTQSIEWSILAAGLYGFGYAGMSPLRTFAISSALGSQSFGMATGALRFVELPFLLSASPLAAYIYDTTGNYQMAFLILVGLIAVACIGPLFIVSGGAKSDAPGFKQQNKTELGLKRLTTTPGQSLQRQSTAGDAARYNPALPATLHCVRLDSAHDAL